MYGMSYKWIVLGCLVFPLIDTALAQNKTADEMTMAEKIEMASSWHGKFAELVEPFTILGNVHYVGARNIGAYLITTDEGHILLDTGVREMHEGLKENIEALGYSVEEVEIILSTHAHFDHVQGHEQMRQATGAKVMAVGLDADALRSGRDLSPLGFEGWDPVREVTTMANGDTVELGGTVLTAHQVPGHTQGCTVWTMTAPDHGTAMELAFFGCAGPNSFVKLRGNEAFPDLIDETLLGFQRMRELSPDIWLSNHPQRQIEDKIEEIRNGQRPHPLLDQQPWDEMVTELDRRFQARLAEQE